MDPEDLRSLARNAGVDLWTLIEAAISVAAKDCDDELKARRDGIVYAWAAATAAPLRCLKCDPEDDRNRRRSNGTEEEEKGGSSPVAKCSVSRSPPTPQSMNRLEVVEDDEEGDETQYRRGNNGDNVTSKILKELLEDEDQSEDQVVNLLQDLADVDVSFQALGETDIGRHVNRFRKHPSADVQRLVKHIVRKWKAFVDNWVKSNSTVENAVNKIRILVIRPILSTEVGSTWNTGRKRERWQLHGGNRQHRSHQGGTRLPLPLELCRSIA